MLVKPKLQNHPDMANLNRCADTRTAMSTMSEYSGGLPFTVILKAGHGLAELKTAFPEIGLCDVGEVYTFSAYDVSCSQLRQLLNSEMILKIRSPARAGPVECQN